jgi:SNF2 family DNA or RNA helicase
MIHDDSGVSRPEELAENMRRYVLRRCKKDVLTSLPPLTKQIVLFENTKKDAEAEKIISKIKTLDDVKMVYSKQPENFAALRKEQAVRKIPKCLEYINDVLEHKKKIVVFTYHNDVINNMYESMQHKTVVISGATSQKNRDLAIANFQYGDARVILVNIKAGGEGITLTAADTCIFVEIDFVPATIEQAIARIHRISQECRTHAIFLFENRTIDAHIAKIVIKKENKLNKIVL